MHSFHLSILRICRNCAFPYSDPYEDITEGYQDHGQDVAEQQVGDKEVQTAVQSFRPHFQTQEDIRRIVEDDHQVEEQGPGDRRGEGDYPDDEDHEAGPPLGDLALEGPPDCKKSADKRKDYFSSYSTHKKEQGSATLAFFSTMSFGYVSF